jgi:hypothetical protein
LVQIGWDLLSQQLGVVGGSGGGSTRDVEANRTMPSGLQDVGQGSETRGGLGGAVHEHDVGPGG